MVCKDESGMMQHLLGEEKGSNGKYAVNVASSSLNSNQMLLEKSLNCVHTHTCVCVCVCARARTCVFAMIWAYMDT
jgi:hypothetical protein